MANLTTLERGAALADIVTVMDADGGVIVSDLLPETPRLQLIEDLATTFDKTVPGSKSGIEHWEGFHGANTRRFCGLAARSDAFVEHALLNPTLLAVADHYLLDHANGYWLNTGQIMAVGPGEPAQYLHRDETNWPEAIADGREITVSCMFALSDFTRSNGATVVIPETQNLPAAVIRGGNFDDEETAYASMPAGSGMIYSGRVIHGAGQNTTSSWRYGMHVSFVVGWLRPEEASPLVVDQKRAASLPERARQLLGWASYHSDGGGRTWLVDFEDASRLFD
ncbi:MAG: phytanoyl-CoA dioxygenase family protein [Acidimicrobiales bacterium]|mgnify:CR=1 FL=1|jgi:ectoine hydroxylase-related dioxygenase (phytanoyl-CoA dioxygenase family)|nr:hypothetical protein [Acidimicrobiaceae bacterium]MDP6078279.1 phytanoyl-CoA dioxygenase family protein [Acidimicrobiales bacterium]MDP7258666.1 phytanoyl-CoA dioxygenase family protein [Acidimicrobiales bacterium]HCV36533.1 hypothetical protein [Acidimicrobiaceae bacterium]HJO80217.1 phytanoyl-CoA dioxygenase family protein [Acidimicrobiales bacterium]|tara:strand:- start:1575 stop:2417 length:843 start_codon:yes stop_codon:yes gene_type:complete